jgi:hypothetical protein
MDNPMESKTSYSLAVIAVGTALVVLFAGAGTIVAVGHDVPQALWAAAGALSGALVGILVPTPGGATPDSAHVADAASVTKAAATSAARAAAAAVTQDPTQSDDAKAAVAEAVKAVREAPIESLVKQMNPTSTPAEVIDGVIGVFAQLQSDAHDRVQTAQQAAIAPAPVENPPAGAELQTEVVKANATQAVLAAAASAATQTRGAVAAVADPDTPRSVSAAPKIARSTLVQLALAGSVLVFALALALLISTGTIHAARCNLANGGKTQGCDSNLLQVGTAMLTLASAAGGILLGLFATPDGKPAPTPTTPTSTK